MSSDRALVIGGHGGLGDQVLQTPTVRSLMRHRHGEVYLETPWPQLWMQEHAGGLRLLDPGPKRLRVADANRLRPLSRSLYADHPSDPERVELRYSAPGTGDAHAVAMIAASAIRQVPGLRVQMDWRRDLVPWGAGGVGGAGQLSRPIVCVCPPVTRTEWSWPARQPHPDAWWEAMRALDRAHRDRDMTVIVMGCWSDGGEEIMGPLPRHCDLDYSAPATLRVEDMLALLVRADAVIGSVSWVLPWTDALDVRHRLILWGGSYHPRYLALSHHGIVGPDEICECGRPQHDCPREIDSQKVREAVEALLR